MPYQTWMSDALRNAGLTVREEPGWEHRGSERFDPHGLVLHHTAGPRVGDAPSLPTVVNGRTDLPGPLANLLLARSGTYYLVAAGKANHAGIGGWNGLYGNAAVFGIEAENVGDGTEPWPAVQVDAYVRGAAVLARGSGFSAANVCAHFEWTRRKIDPVGFDMPAFRARVNQLLALNGPPPEDDTPMFIIFSADGGLWVLAPGDDGPKHIPDPGHLDAIKNLASESGGTIKVVELPGDKTWLKNLLTG